MLKSLAVCSWSLRPRSITDLTDAMTRCGVRSAQLSLDPIISGDWRVRGVLGSFDRAGLSICSGMMTTVGEDYSTLETIRQTGGLRPDTHWHTNLQRAHACAQAASELGITLVTLHAGFIPQDDDRLHEVMADRIGAVAEIFAAEDIMLGLETGQEGAKTLLGLLSTISDRSGIEVGVNFDPANMILYAMGDPARAIEELSGHIVQVHMKDAIATRTRGTWGQEVCAGTGEVDWAHFFGVLGSLSQEVDVVIEREAGDSRIDDVRAARELAEAFMGGERP